MQRRHRRPIIAAKVYFSISTQDIALRHRGCIIINHQSDAYRYDISLLYFFHVLSMAYSMARRYATSFVYKHMGNQRRRGSTLMEDTSYI